MLSQHSRHWPTFKSDMCNVASLPGAFYDWHKYHLTGNKCGLFLFSDIYLLPLFPLLLSGEMSTPYIIVDETQETNTT